MLPIGVLGRGEVSARTPTHGAADEAETADHHCPARRLGNGSGVQVVPVNIVIQAGVVGLENDVREGRRSERAGRSGCAARIVQEVAAVDIHPERLPGTEVAGAERAEIEPIAGIVPAAEGEIAARLVELDDRISRIVRTAHRGTPEAGQARTVGGISVGRVDVEIDDHRVDVRSDVELAALRVVEVGGALVIIAVDAHFERTVATAIGHAEVKLAGSLRSVYQTPGRLGRTSHDRAVEAFGLRPRRGGEGQHPGPHWRPKSSYAFSILLGYCSPLPKRRVSEPETLLIEKELGALTRREGFFNLKELAERL